MILFDFLVHFFHEINRKVVSEISHVRDRNEMDGAFRLYLMCTNSKMKERGSGGARESILSCIADLLG